MTAICSHIKAYEKLIWNYLSDIFKYNLKSSEIGITNDVIYRIVKFYGGRPNGCEVYAFNAFKEIVRGADIDLFIKSSNGMYTYYKLQAKLMNYRGKYIEISKWGSNAQFHTLINSAGIESAYPLYLLYNGLTLNSRLGQSNKCGLTIIDARKIRDYRYDQHFLGKNPTVKILTYDILHTLVMKPFHVLFCEDEYGFPMPAVKRESDIFKAFPYKRIDTSEIGREPEVVETDEPNEDAIVIIKERNLAPIRIIINSRE